VDNCHFYFAAMLFVLLDPSVKSIYFDKKGWDFSFAFFFDDLVLLFLLCG